MNRFQKVMALIALAIVGQNISAVEQSRLDALQDRVKKFSRNMRTFVKCARTQEGCPQEIKTELMQDAKLIGGLVTAAALAIGGGAMMYRSYKERMASKERMAMDQEAHRSQNAPGEVILRLPTRDTYLYVEKGRMAMDQEAHRLASRKADEGAASDLRMKTLAATPQTAEEVAETGNLVLIKEFFESDYFRKLPSRQRKNVKNKIVERIKGLRPPNRTAILEYLVSI